MIASAIMMNGYEKRGGFDDEPEPNSFVKAFDAFRTYSAF